MSIVKLRCASGETAEIHEYGAQVTSWRTADGTERLFLSEKAEFRPNAAIRGGVPVIFPQFAALGPLPKHGFARVANWQRTTVPQAQDSAHFRLQDDAVTRSIWPHRFVADYSIVLSRDALRLELSIRNTDMEPFTFTAALHAYLRVSDIARVKVCGLQGLRYIDSAAGGAQSTETDPELQLSGELDRIYVSALQPIRVLELDRPGIICSAQGFTDVVIWNPGAEKAAQLSDLEPGGFRRMLCVEAAVIDTPVELRPQTSWSGVQILQLESQ